MELEEKKRKRFEFLRIVYELSNADSVDISTEQVTRKIGIDYDGVEASQIARYLKNEGLLDYISFTTIHITHKGIKVVEEALAKPNEPTEFFPPAINFIKVNQMHNSQILQGSTGSNQTFNLTEQNLDSLEKFIQLFEQKFSELPFNSEDDKNEANAEIQTIKTQLDSPRPKEVVIQESRKTLRNVLEGMTGSILASELLKYLLGS